MPPLRFYPLILALSIVAALPASAIDVKDPGEFFLRGNTAYEAKDFAGAYRAYLAAVTSRSYAPDVFYNLGNAAYRLDRPGEAALWYRRALVMKPSHAESRQNLRFLEKEFGYLATEWNAFERLVSYLTRSQLLILSCAGGWGILLCLATAFAFTRQKWRPAITLLGTLSAFLLVFAAVALLAKRNAPVADQSVVTADEVVARTSPADDGKDVISLPPGSQVTLLAQRAAWSYVAVPGDLRGWVRSDELSPLWPFDASFVD